MSKNNTRDIAESQTIFFIMGGNVGCKSRRKAD
jgi:hypothetical protein